MTTASKLSPMKFEGEAVLNRFTYVPSEVIK